MSTLNERANTALDDIIAARAPGLNTVTQLTLKMMVMDVLYANARKQFAQEYPQLDPLFSAWSVELAARSVAFMESHQMTQAKRHWLGTKAKELAGEMMERFAQRVVMPPVH